ncbi:E3 ubiquitin-protein ligase RHA2A [Heracleum sosnowskyi]|uniref:E3 ubiquitin-protein ligase RHA2A n=1 Tax=Heracleum sosnowskyi TaxID=360622 RepID=A0AAD8HW77_9APIA|nr:E3 ubiquitin-protein ligase RHA2A [Heracleum sosnowskyi]
MGLQNELTNVSSESLPILLVILIANCVSYLRTLSFTILHSLSPPRFHSDNEVVHDNNNNAVNPLGSSLASLIVLAEQLNINRLFSYTYGSKKDEDVSGSDCIVCLNRFSKGDHVRKLACCHVFHKECFDGWLDHLNFNCPLCRSPLKVSDERVGLKEQRVTDDLLTWFALT